MERIVHLAAWWAGALAIGGIVAYLVAIIRIETGAARQLSDFKGGPRPKSTNEKFGERVASRLPISLSTWEDHLRWAQRGGYYPEWSIGQLVFVAMLYGACACGILLLYPAPISLGAPVLAFIYPFIGVRSKANRVRKQTIRSLPETASLIAAEMSANVPPEQALNRSTRLPGPLPVLIGEAVALSQRSGKPLFSRRDGGLNSGAKLQGALIETFTQANLPAVRSFASQLDRVSEKGVAGADQMSAIAQAMSREYRARLMSETKKLDSRLVMATALFFFIPFVMVILGSFMLPILSMF